MTVSVTPVDVGSAPGDDTGDKARTAFIALNANEANFKAAIELLQGRHFTIQNSTLNPWVLGARYMCNNHAGITFTLPATFANSATSFSDIQIINADNASDVTLTPASGDAFFVNGATHGVDTTFALTPGNKAVLSPRTTDSEWDLVVVGSSDLVNDLTPQLGGDLDVNGKSFVSVSDGDIVFAPDGTGVLEQRNSTTAQTHRIYNTFTDASNYERLSLGGDGTIASEFAGTGSAQDITIKLADAAGANKLSITDSADAEVAYIDSLGAAYVEDVFIARSTSYRIFENAGKLNMLGSRGMNFKHPNDVTTLEAFTFRPDGAGDELFSTSILQSFMVFRPTINQSSTAGYNGIFLDVTETALGSGPNNLIDMHVAGSSLVLIDNTGTYEADKGTADEGFFNFKATADADATSAISTLTTSGAIQGHVQMEINGVKRWFAFLADPA